MLMRQNQVKTVLSYIKDVLGVEGFALPKKESAPSTLGSKSNFKPYIFISSQSGNDNALLEMQSRMVGALKLNIDDVEFANLDQTNVQIEWLTSAKVIVIFGIEALNLLPASLNLNSLKIGENKSGGQQRVICTHSLKSLASSSALKKETWAHLQSVF